MTTKRKQHSYKFNIVAMSISLAVLVAIMTTLLLLQRNTKVCEFFATTIARAWIYLSGHIFGWLPFSMYELFLIKVILGGVFFVAMVIWIMCKHKWKSLLTTMLTAAIAVVSFVNVYTMTASFTYNRKDLPKEIYCEYGSEDLSYNEAVQLATVVIEELNNAYAATEHDKDGNIVYPYSFKEMTNVLAEEYKRLDGLGYFSQYTPRAKKIVNKWLMSQMHVTGVFFAPFGEANINGNEKGMDLPVTLAHELAHGKGVMQEYQADIVAFYLTATSEDPYLRYSALSRLAYSAISIVRTYPTQEALNQYPQTDCEQLEAQINLGVIQERRNDFAFWAKFSLLEDIGEFFNDLYLKSQQQQNGTDSYYKPIESEGTGVPDDAGEEIVRVVSFSGLQNLLVNLYKQGYFVA